MASLTFLLTQQRCTLMTCSLQALIAGQNSLKHMFDIWSPDPFCQRLLFVNGCTNARKNKQPWFFFKGSGLKSPLVPKRLCNPKTDACRRGDVGIERAKQNDWGPSKILNGFWKIPLTRPDFRLSDSYYSIFVIFISLAHWILSRHEKKNAAGSISCWSSQTYCKCHSSPRGINQRAIRVYCKQLINKDCYHLRFWTLVSQSV